MNTKVMTKEEAHEYLNNKKVYVNGKSAEIQKKLFEVGFKWSSGATKVQHTEDPFIYMHDGVFFRGRDMNAFKSRELKEITADDILSIKIASDYAPFGLKARIIMVKI